MIKIPKESSQFPETLKNFGGSPDAIYCEGNINLLKSRCIAIVGSRSCTAYGRSVARNIGKRMAENNITVVSGLARGIDTESHKGSLDAGGNTIAVLGCGLDIYYPPENRKLQDLIRKNGLLVSEYPLGYEAKPFTFPMRNRIISGLSECVVIVEAAERSGALITAEAAVEQGRRVYSVPGNITSMYSFGTNKLIRDGADVLVVPDDILFDMGINPQICDEIMKKLGNDETTVYSVIKNRGEMTVDEIYQKTDIKPSKIIGIITLLEMKGLVFSSSGKIFVAKF